MSVETSATDRFSLRVPPSWYEFDVWRATRTGDLARLVDQRIAENANIKPFRGPLIRALREAAEQAERHGAVLCAAMTDPVDDEGVLAATLAVFHTPGAADPELNTVEAIAARITAIARTSETKVWRQVSLVEVAAGRAVRVSGVEVNQIGSRVLDCAVMQTLFPAPGGGVVNVVLVSPQTELTDPMLDLFEAITATFTWTTHSYTGTPTTEGP